MIVSRVALCESDAFEVASRMDEAGIRIVSIVPPAWPCPSREELRRTRAWGHSDPTPPMTWVVYGQGSDDGMQILLGLEGES